MKTLTVGIGCRLHSSAEQIEAAVLATLGSHAFDEISTIASIDIKAHEAGFTRILRTSCAAAEAV